ncbi:MAG TPA: hypothetical protein VGQ69_01610 [Gemmatimonadales bacterium]|nr:hypothetical protein [Gemmatimonadales bacterium]
MRVNFRVLPLAALGLLVQASASQAQSARSASAAVAKVRDDRFKWFFGAEGGALLFETQSQTQSGVPAAGAHLAVISRRAGMMIGVDEAFGSNEPTAFVDPNTGNQVQPVQFDRIRRYGFNLTGYPVRGALEPYLGVGFGLLQVLSPELTGTFTSKEELDLSAQEAHDRAASGFVSFLAGLQFRVGRVAAFGQYQINSSPAAGSLLRGPGHLIMGGIRLSLGSAKEEIRGGGY